MGWHVSFACVKGKDREAVLDALGLEALPGEEDSFESAISISDLPTGWIVVACKDVSLAVTSEWIDALAADGAEVVACQVEERAMGALTVGRRADGSTWSVDYDCEKGDQFDIKGSPPEALAAIEAAAWAKHHSPDAEADYLFDVPADLVKAMTGFRYDANEFSPGVELVFNPVQRRRPAKDSASNGGGFLARLFGRK